MSTVVDTPNPDALPFSWMEKKEDSLQRWHVALS